MPLLAEELIRLKPDVLLAGPTVAVVAANQVTASVPIVGINITDPVGLGLAANHARPGGNVTGTAVMQSELVTKRLELLSKVVAELQKCSFPAGSPTLQVKLSGDQEVPPVTTSASGSGTITVNDDKTVSGDVASGAGVGVLRESVEIRCFARAAPVTTMRCAV